MDARTETDAERELAPLVCSPTQPNPRQPRLFAELVESAVTRDQPFEDPDGSWGTRIARPAGKRWRSDFSHDKRTGWTRRRPIVPPRRIAGRWRRR
jgi:hypothetical protein